MKLVIGGAYQGKRQYALARYGGESLVPDFHLFLLELLKEGRDPVAYVQAHMDMYRDKVVICEDICCGVVPVDPLMRQWREATGRALALLARESDEVVRVFCGLGTSIKGNAAP